MMKLARLVRFVTCLSATCISVTLTWSDDINNYDDVTKKKAFNPIPVVPFPQVCSLGRVRIGLNVPEFRITSDQSGLLYDPIISYNARRYEKYFSLFKGLSRSDGITTVNVNVKEPDTPQKLSFTNETYHLQIREGQATVELAAVTRIGILRGLETLYQLYNVTDGTFPVVDIEDYPRYNYRGLLIDTSRHFLSPEMIFKVIEGMAMTKLNVLHWHIVDDPSFPYYSAAFPDLSKEGAYDGNHVYSLSDVAEVIQYARLHGVIVLPEFDTPGHTLSWGKGQPGLLAYCPGRGTFGSDFGPIDPTLDQNYDFLRKLLSEVSGVFGAGYLHLGGDEVSFYCWAGNSKITQFMKEHNITSHADLESYYEVKLLDIVAALNQSYIVWEEIFNNGLRIKPDTIIHVWKGNWQKTLSKVVKKGYRTILSSPWYLDHISFGFDWKNYYSVEPTQIDATPDELELIEGGEACMWAEYIDNTNILSRTFPRASAVAERLWSSKSRTDINDAAFRLELHRCGMCARDIPAETASMRSFCPFEYTGWA